MIDGKEEKINELSSRFYAFVWANILFSAYLLYGFFFRLPDKTTIPFTDFEITDSTFLMKIVFFLFCGSMIVLDIEWLRFRFQEKNVSDKIYFALALVLTMIVSLLVYPVIVENTPLQSIPRWLWLINIFLGGALGKICFHIYRSCRSFRDKEYVMKVKVPRIPTLSKIYLAENVIFGAMIIGATFSINYVWRHTYTYIVFSIFVLATVYFFIRGRLTFNDKYADRYKKNANTIDSLNNAGSYIGEIEKLHANNPDKHALIIAIRQQQRKQYHHFSVEFDNTINLSIFDRPNINTSDAFVCVNATKGDMTAKLNVPILFIREAFLRLQEENIELSNESIFNEAMHWAVITVLWFEAYKYDTSDRPRIIINSVFCGFPFIVRLLLNYAKCNLNELMMNEWSPLLAAAAQNEPIITEILLHYGADPNKPNLNGVTPLMFSAFYNHHSVCKILLDNYPDLNLQDNEGKTALMVAVENDSVEVFDLLLNAGANLTIRNYDGKTALDLAYYYGFGEMARKIKEKQHKAI